MEEGDFLSPYWIHEGGKEGWSEGLKEARLDGLCQRLLNWHTMQKYRMTDGLHGCSNDMEIEFQHALPNTNDVSHSLMIMRSSGAGAGAGAWGVGCEHVDPGTLSNGLNPRLPPTVRKKWL